MDELLLDEEGYKQFYDKLDELKNMVNLNGKTLSSSFNEYVGDGWHDNPLYEEAVIKNRMIDTNIKNMLIESKKIRKIEDKKENGHVNIGDILKIEFIYSDDDKEEEILKLTGKYFADNEAEIKEISLNSPIGRAIYKGKIGNIYSYNVDNRTFNVRIIEKL